MTLFTARDGHTLELLDTDFDFVALTQRADALDRWLSFSTVVVPLCHDTEEESAV
jgi:hypothetical protein